MDIGVSDLFPKMNCLRGFLGEAWYRFSIIVTIIIVSFIPPLRLSVAFAPEYTNITEMIDSDVQTSKELS